jgi:hypothetical protein
VGGKGGGGGQEGEMTQVLYAHMNNKKIKIKKKKLEAHPFTRRCLLNYLSYYFLS